MISFIKKEAVICISLVAAFLSCFFNPPSADYIDFIDFRVLILLFSLMAAVAGAKKANAFSFICQKLLSGISNTRRLVFLLLLACFTFSMLITNDVALITLIPLAIMTLRDNRKLLIPAVVLMTVAANLGSALTPMGNPQNLYLFSVFSMNTKDFFGTTLPLTGLSLALLSVCVLFIPAIPTTTLEQTERPEKKRLIPWMLLFGLALLTVIRLVDPWILLGLTFLIVLTFDYKLLRQVDYSLLLTFVAFFIFVGNMKAYPIVSTFLRTAVAGKECLWSIVLSQVISNVPAACLLSGFASDPFALLLGVNLGGLGTPIASMASLISYKLYAAFPHAQKGRYMLFFLLFNFGTLAVLWGLCTWIYPNLP